MSSTIQRRVPLCTGVWILQMWINSTDLSRQTFINPERLIKIETLKKPGTAVIFYRWWNFTLTFTVFQSSLHYIVINNNKQHICFFRSGNKISQVLFIWLILTEHLFPFCLPQIQKGKLHGSIDVGLSVMSIKKRARRIDLDTEEHIYHLKVTPNRTLSF